jgi:hypothetical protein
MNIEEAIESINGGADIIDVKNPKEGSLGANFPWVIKSIAEIAKKHGREVSAAIGDMNFKPGTASLAALAAAFCGVNYVKVGLYSIKSKSEAYEVLLAVVRAVKDFDSNMKVVAAAYADCRRIDTIPPLVLPAIAAKAGVDGVMVDTALKDGSTLFDYMDVPSITTFIEDSHDRGLFCALAGSLNWNHVDVLKRLNPDVIGVRTIVCENGRNSKIKSELVSKFIEAMR